jgi:hypothetical protein
MITLARRAVLFSLAATVLLPAAAPHAFAAGATVDSIAAMIARGEPVNRIEQAFAERVRSQLRQRGAGYNADADIRSIIAAARREIARKQRVLDARLTALRSGSRGTADISGTGGVALLEMAKQQNERLASNISSIEAAMTRTAKSVERKMNQ